MGNILTMGTGMGQVQFYDLRAKKFLESAVHTGRFVALKMSNGTVVSPTSYYLPVFRGFWTRTKLRSTSTSTRSFLLVLLIPCFSWRFRIFQNLTNSHKHLKH
jgi:hypothetical protein